MSKAIILSRLKKLLFEDYSDDKDAKRPFHHSTLGAALGCLCAGWLGVFARQGTPALTHFPELENTTHTMGLHGTQLCQPSTTPSTCTVKGDFKTFTSDRALPSGDTFWAQGTEGLHTFWTSLIKENQVLKAFRKHFPLKDSEAAKAPNLSSVSTVDRKTEIMNC